MNTKSVLSRIEQAIRRFGKARDGHVVITFAFALLPLIGFVGTAVDFSRASSARTSLQAAADATALAMSKIAPSLSASQLQTQSLAYFKALYTSPEATNTLVTTTYTTTGGSQVKVDATSTVATYFIKVVGTDYVNISASATAKWGSTKLRVALALDVTGSMNSAGKLSALKTATNNLIDQLKAAANVNGDVYIAIVPFNKDVNVGSGNYSANWLGWTLWEDEPAVLKASKPSNWDQVGPGSSCPFNTNDHGFGCASTPTGTTSTNTIPSSGSYSGYICPNTDNGDETGPMRDVEYNGCYDSQQKQKVISTGWGASCGWVSNCSCTGWGNGKVCKQTYYEHTWIKNAHTTWNGCVTDRDQDYDLANTSPTTAIAATLFPPEQYHDCPAVIVGQTYNWTALHDAVNNLTAKGYTNQGIGLAWAWMALTDGAPMSPPAIANPNDTSKVIILMSDGLNTQNRYSTSAGTIDARQATMCTNVKAAGITLYTIHVNTDGDPTSTVLQNCASSPDKFFALTSGNQLITAFNTIGTALSQLRLAF